MNVLCETCEKYFQFLTESEGWSMSEEYHDHKVLCPNCKEPEYIIIRSFKWGKDIVTNDDN